jgi:hypothetical protein
MSTLRLIKTNFTAGEIAPQLLGRGDLRAYENGARTLKNVVIHPTGGLSRRRGTYYIDTARGNGRLITFAFNTEQTYLIAATDMNLAIYHNGIKLIDLASPWTIDQIKNLTWTQSADTVLFCHPDVPPQKLLRLSDTSWTLSGWVFTKADTADVLLQPYYKFADDNVTLTPSATTGTITIIASIPVFQSGHAGTRLRIGDKEVLITSYSSSTIVTADVKQTLSGIAATVDWAEQSFSAIRGYPQCAVYHQDRLVIGGSRDLPNRLWFSKSGDLWNFDKGDGLDADSIEFGLLSDQINIIRALFSGRHLQVFTSGAEWIVTGTPLTPTNIQLNRQTRIGSVMDRYIPPVDIDGATMFVGSTGQDMREFLYTDVEQAYQANDLALISRHLFKDPVDQCFDPLQRILFLPLQSGTMVALTIYRTEDVFAWSRIETDGTFVSVATVDRVVYALIKRQDNQYFIERFDTDYLLDSCLSGEVQNPTDTWSGLDHLNNCTVSIIADGIVAGEKTVGNNEVILDAPARNVIIGLPYTHEIDPLPPGVLTLDGGGRAMRLVRAVFRLQDTAALSVDVGRGFKDISLRNFAQNSQMDQPPQQYNGDMTVHAFGWTTDGTQSLWRLQQSSPLPCTILGVTTEIKVNE